MARNSRNRRGTGRDISGWIPIDKPAGQSSVEVLKKTQNSFSARKAGHAGTLDRAASGILAIAFGEATKTVPYLSESSKSYRFTIRFGLATNTCDAEGEIVASKDKRPSDDEIKSALAKFRGQIMQVPPRFSAIKIDGERAHERARRGEDFTPSARPLHVEELEFLQRIDGDHAEFRLTCGKGGYVRSIARDLGEELGCLGHANSLRRIRSGPFDEGSCVALEAIEESAECRELDGLLFPLETVLGGLPELRCTKNSAAKLRNGNSAAVFGDLPVYGEEAWVSCEGRAVAIGQFKAGELFPKRVFSVSCD
ncbi:MAG: tRNA pseudouridine(55) synthase TruB [Albidovulum sp.]|nr:tRNA pseudouridine(55) synthase TruB [Albidovulum sp.]MDE0306193.1 tRNA pseudouridine(55) synthase TruB [Albidovulum sp.]